MLNGAMRRSGALCAEQVASGQGRLGRMPLICLGMDTLSRTRVNTSALPGFALFGKYLESLWVLVK